MSAQATSEYAFGVSEFTTWPWSFEQDVRAYAELGVDAIEITEYKLDRENYAAQLAMVRAAGLDVTSVQTTIHSLFADSLQAEPPDPGHRLQEMRAALQRLAPHVPAGTPFVVITGAAPDGNCARVMHTAENAYRELAQLAAGLGMRIAFEPLNPVLFHTDTAVWSLADGLELVERVGHPAFGLCVDVWNVWQTPDLAAVIARARKRIFLAQTSDWRCPRANADRRSLGEGVIPIPGIVAALRAAGYEGPYVLEIFSTQALPDSLWSSDLRLLIRKNMDAFKNIWRRALA